MQVGHVLDSLIIQITSAVTVASGALLIAAPPENPDQFQQLLILLLPLIGALIASGGCIMLNPNQETRSITIGRGIFGLFFGVTVPQMLAIVHPGLQAIALKPIVLVLMGGGVAALVFIFSKPFTRELYRRSDRLAKTQADKLEKRFLPSSSDSDPTKQ